ncbi:hypothetical protein QYE76_031462 [Lolium multiflorum]|uniref:CCHC-type domain-containing protein n=1 Tax=Lolium multiflorum TaxID=4521 RepID=A0AAD8VIH4_LOLMU|nr:hypothetical protein QYE76_031462 [Lolium multiflorum]
MAEEAGGSGPAKGKEPEIEDMFSHLELNDEELDEVVISVEEAKEYQKAGRWLAIGRVLTTRNFSAEALFAKMKIVWNLSRDPICREVGENLFTFQMHCLGDWKKVVHQGPWTFRGWGVLIEDYDGLSNPESVTFDGMYVWAQIHGIPELYRKQNIVDDLSRKIGLVRETQLSPKLFFEGNYVRVRVRIIVTKALMRFVTLTLPEGKKRLMVKYEKIPYYCKHCGMLGHNHEECGDGDWEEKQLQWGTWLLASRRATQPVPGPRRFTPRAPSRGGRSGTGVGDLYRPRKRSSDDAELNKEDDLTDTGTSPLKQPTENAEVIREENPLALKLDFTDENAAGLLENVHDGGWVDPSVPPLPPAYVKSKPRAKIQKTDMSKNTMASSAASLEEDRRAQ